MNDYGIHRYQKNKDGETSQSTGFHETDGALSPLLQKDGAIWLHQKNRMRQQQQYQRQPQQQQYQRQPQQQSSPMDVDKIKWQQNLMVAAKEVWGRLTDDELLESGGDFKTLSALVSDRYSISRCEADEQVADFLNKLKSV